MSDPAPPQPLNVLIPIYEGFNSLDVGGPLDVLCNYALRNTEGVPAPFNITITAAKQPTTAYEFMNIVPDYSFDEIIPKIQNGDYDILLVPGCGPGATDKILNSTSTTTSILCVLKTFIKSDNRGREKWFVSICTGAILAGAVGAFDDRNATTHWQALDRLRDICVKYKAPAKSVTRQRWIDGGVIKPAPGMNVDTRIVSSGGISCCIDCCLWLVQQILGTEKAVAVAEMMDYRWICQTKTTPAPYCQ